MREDPHPFIQLPTDHDGWDRKEFNHLGRRWTLLVINTLKADCSGELRSSISVDDRSTRGGYWRSGMMLSLPCRLTVDATVKMIDRMVAAFEVGREEGTADAKAEIRRVLGITT